MPTPKVASKVAGNTGYPNYVLQNEFENQYKSKLDLMNFVTVDNSLEGTAGDTVKINVYTATEGTEVLGIGEGNSKAITVSYAQKQHTIKLLQNKFEYNDEQAMNDPKIVEKGLGHMVVDMFNMANGLAMAEFTKATLTSEYTKLDFDAFVDAVATFPNNEEETLSLFGFVNSKDKAEIRKNLKDDLKYIEAFVRTGYIGTVNGVNLYTSNIASEGSPIIASKEAVTYYSKQGTVVEQDRDIDIRFNTIVSRKYGLFALTDATKAVKMVKKATV